ncbi:MAG: 30S ribosomal protein S12 methylthiotransferase RimO [Anaerolineae bacterium]|nr:30S ribosomal protein S12 methylthiotransferase RimO [Anaerolineae bacterium]
MKQRKTRSKRGAERPLRFYIASLGCPKNTVDSSGMAVLLQSAGYEFTLDSQEADLIIVNTCGFIELARQESLETLQDIALDLRPEQKLVAAGCWAQRDPEALLASVPELDAILGTRSWGDVVSVAERLLTLDKRTVLQWVEERLMMQPEEVGVPGYVISGRSAFLKIADGCSRGCAFCAIPNIKGPGVSRSMEAILADARQLQDLGVLEINLIAQDSTFYGHDLGLKDGLAQLLEKLVQVVPALPWIRIMYAFPGFITPRLIDTMAHYPQILPYIDIPLQHAHPDVLRRMYRPFDIDAVRQTVAHLRERLPGVALRTAFIVGFPGETDHEFRALMDFVEEMQFDRVGVFTYSHEQGTASEKFEDDVPSQVKAERYEALMLLQQPISKQLNFSLIGQRLPVLLEGSEEGLTVGRTYRDAPEIDGLVLISEAVTPHRMVTAEIVDATVYDLIARIVPES